MRKPKAYPGCKQVKDITERLVILVCWDCKRIGIYPRDRFADLVGPDTYMPDAKTLIAARVCEKALDRNALLFDRCQIQYYRPDLRYRDQETR